MQYTNSELYIEPEVSEYMDFLNSKDSAGKNILTRDRVDRNFEMYHKAMNLIANYPDILLDLAKPQDSQFNLFFYQRIVLRQMNRMVQTYVTATRAFSKSFLAFISRYLQAMIIPGHKTFVVADVKAQAAQIAKEKIIGDIWVKFPLLANEMKKIRVNGKLRDAYTLSKDSGEFRFTHGGTFDIVGAGASTRGGRRHSGIIEEVITQDQTALNEVVIPLMNVPRRTKLGYLNPNEPHAAKLFITSSGFQQTYAYDKMIETLCFAALMPSQYCCMGFDWRLPVMHGLISDKSIRDAKASPTFEQDSFDREFGSVWSGSPKGAAFNMSRVMEARFVNNAEFRAKPSKDSFYVMAADIAKDGDARTTLIVSKVTPRESLFTHKFVYATEIKEHDFEHVSNQVKELVLKFEPRVFVYDANGVGAALRDWLIKPTTGKDGAILPALGIINPPKELKTKLPKVTKQYEICYEIKASQEKNTKMNRMFFGRMNTGSIGLLKKPKNALIHLTKYKWFNDLSVPRKQQVMRPYQYTDQMVEEFKNLDVVDMTDGTAAQVLKVERRNLKIQKDFFSTAIYLVFGTHEHIEVPYFKKKLKKISKASDYIMVSSGRESGRRDIYGRK